MGLVQIFIFWPPYKQLGRPTEATFGTLFWPLYLLNRGFRDEITVETRGPQPAFEPKLFQ